MISVLDYGAGNASSVMRMIERSGGKTQRITISNEIDQATKLVIPGVGAFDHGMDQLSARGLLDSLNKAVQERGVPILGICLGMQLMCRSSEEGVKPGLGWIDAEVTRFVATDENRLRIPHMGWRTVEVIKDNLIIPLDNVDDRFYFVHSYKVTCNDSSDVVAMVDYGGNFVAAFQRRNIWGVQFHPEKSHRFGMGLVRRFVEANFAAV